MRFSWAAKFLAPVLAVCLAFSVMPVFANSTENIEVIFTDVTESNLTTLSGESKIKVGVKGAAGKINIAQMALSFEGDLNYKSIQFLKGENNPPACVLISPNAASANAEKSFMTSVISKDGISFGEEEDLFILTFAGEAGKTVTLKTAELDDIYCSVDGVEKHAAESKSQTATASSKANEGKKALITLKMDKVTDFVAGSEEEGYKGSGIELKLTSEQTPGYTVYTVLNNVPVSKGGHRDSTSSTPSFLVESMVLADDTYTVELSGIGYVSYKKTGVNFENSIALSNADFIPGDVNADMLVNADDRTLAEEFIKNGEYSEAADFNRDGKVDKYDLAVFADLPDEVSVPDKMAAPSVTGGNKRITISWTKPSDDSITGYIVKYGTSSTKLSSTENVTDKSATSVAITGLSADTTYYVQIAAKNAAGTGEFSNVASAKTNADSSGGGGTGGGGGGTGGGGTATPATPSEPVTPSEPAAAEGFTDIGNYAWAREAIYTLKDRGIISGVSDTEFAPANHIKRGDFMLILTRMLDVQDEFSENFADVSESTYYYKAIGSAKAAGIAQGSGEFFMPENSITRQDLITLAYRAFLAKEYIAETSDLSALEMFVDSGDISDYAKTAMASMVQAGIIKGADGLVNPKGNATRAEVAVMCARLADLMK